MLAWMAVAEADECACLTWDSEWAWDPCDRGDCQCPCADPGGGGGTTPDEPGTRCSVDPPDPPSPGARCMLVESVCAEADCCDERVADCETGTGQAAGCRCATGGAFGGVEWLVAGVAWVARRAHRR